MSNANISNDVSENATIKYCIDSNGVVQTSWEREMNKKMG